MNLRRIMIGGVIAVPLLAGGAWVGARALLPGMVKRQVIERLQERFGLPAQVQEVDLGLSSIELLGVEVGDDRGAHPAWLHADHVSIRVSVWNLLWERSAAVSAVRVGKVRAELRRDHHAFGAFRQHMRGSDKHAPAPSSASVSSAMTIEIAQLSALASDAHGTLVELEAEQLTYAQGTFSGEVRQATLGQAPGTVVRVRDAQVHVERGDAGMVLRELHVGTTAVELGSPDVSPLRSRLGRVLSPRDDEPAADAVVADAVAADDESTADTAATTLDALLSRVTEGTLIEFERATVTQGSDVYVRDLKASAQVSAGDEVLLSAAGHTAGDGSIEWKLRVWPRQVRGEGSVDLSGVPLGLFAPLLPRLPWHEIERSKLDAQLVLEGDGVTRIGWSGRFALTDVSLRSERLAATPIRVESMSLEGRGHFASDDRRLSIVEGRVGLGAASASLQGVIEWTPDHYLFDLALSLPRSPCDKVLAAIPRDVLGEVAAFRLSGIFAGKLRLKIDSRALRDTVLEMDVEDRCEFIEVPVMADLRRFTGRFRHYAIEPDGAVFEMETGPGTSQWTPIEEISPLFVHAVLAHEDTQFFSHHGFAPQHIRGALVRNLEAGRYVLGASTISMQLVKNILLHREKTLARKAQEVVLTWWVERTLDKRDIIELYLNVIEYGPSVYGIRNAARYYFNREPSELSPAESVFLSTILPNPKAYHSFFDKNALSSGWTERMRNQLQRMQSRGWYAPETAQYGLNELANFRFYPEGTVRTPSATPMPTGTALLPYQSGALLTNSLPTPDQLNFATIDGGD